MSCLLGLGCATLLNTSGKVFFAIEWVHFLPEKKNLTPSQTRQDISTIPKIRKKKKVLLCSHLKRRHLTKGKIRRTFQGPVFIVSQRKTALNHTSYIWDFKILQSILVGLFFFCMELKIRQRFKTGRVFICNYKAFFKWGYPHQIS